MSLLGDVKHFLENNRKLVIVGRDYRQVFGTFNTHVFRIAPATPCPNWELEHFLSSFRSWIPDPEETSRISFYFDSSPAHGLLQYKETIGKEKVLRTFTVDDAVMYGGKGFKKGPQEPVEEELARMIWIELFPTEEEARRGEAGLTLAEIPQRGGHTA